MGKNWPHSFFAPPPSGWDVFYRFWPVVFGPLSYSRSGGNAAMHEFQITSKDKKTSARAGLLKLSHGSVETPCYMPVGTQASVKALSPEDVLACGSEILLANTYHLMLRP